MTALKPVLVLGASEFGQTVRELVVACGRRFAGFVDDWQSGPEIVATQASVCASHAPDRYDVALAVGYKHIAARRELAHHLRGLGYAITPLVHPQAYVAPSASIDEGAVVMARAAIDVRVRIGPLTVVWPGAIVSHDCAFDGNTFVSPGAVICGRCRIGADSFIGAGSIIVNDVIVPAGTFLKAGTLFKTSPAPTVERQTNNR